MIERPNNGKLSNAKIKNNMDNVIACENKA